MKIRTALGRRDTRARGRDSHRCSRRATSSCSSAISAPARRRSRKGSRAGSASTVRSRARRSRIVQEYEGRLPVAHVDVYRLDRVQELHDLGFDELDRRRRVTIVEWGDLVAQALPADRLGRAARARRRRRRTRCWSSVPRCPLARPASRDRTGRVAERRRRLMLLLGDRHRDPARRRRARVGRRGARSRRAGRLADSGPPRHAEALAPAIEYLLRRVRTRARPRCPRSRSASARACSPDCAWA